MSEPVISVENVSKCYQLGVIDTGTFRGDVQRWWTKLRGLPDPFLKVGEQDHGNREGETIWALKDVSFQVHQGETLGIIGRNGAGKSTLLKILSRVTAPTTGEVRIKGRIASLLEVGTGFHQELTGRENVYLNGAILGMSRHEIEEKFDEIVDFSGVEKYIDTPVKRYSSGMYVRLAFAVAAHLEPEILIVDEVLAVGDAEFQKKCLGKMGNVASEGRTVLFVSHNMIALKNLCERSILLANGHSVMDEITSNVVDVYLSSFGEYIDEKTLNVKIDSTIGDDVCLRAVRVRDQKGYPTSTIDIGQAFEIEIDIFVHHNTSTYNLSMTLYTPEGTCVFATSPRLSGLTIMPGVKGLNRFSCKIPANLLNEGRYIVNLRILLGNLSVLKQNDAFIFEVRDNGDQRDGNFGKLLGVVRPELDWSLSKIDTE